MYQDIYVFRNICHQSLLTSFWIETIETIDNLLIYTNKIIVKFIKFKQYFQLVIFLLLCYKDSYIFFAFAIFYGFMKGYCFGTVPCYTLSFSKIMFFQFCLFLSVLNIIFHNLVLIFDIFVFLGILIEFHIGDSQFSLV